MIKHREKFFANMRRWRAATRDFLKRLWHKTLPKNKWLRRTLLTFVVVVLLCLSTMYAVAVWYQHEQAGKPTVLGVSFIADYAKFLSVDPHKTFDAILDDLHVKQLRLVSYWSDIEPQPGTYDFSELDWEMQQAAAHGAKVSLAIGLRQPRWPECHAPSWVDTSKPESTWEPQLETYMTAVINRYKNSPALGSYQLENEFFNSFGACHNFDRQRLADELNLVKKLDPRHPIIISRSNNYAGLSLGQPLPDEIGISVYRRVWSPWVDGYFQYPFPSWYYAFLAGAEQIFTGKPSVIHELQAEPWPPAGKNIKNVSLSEQNKTFDAQRFKSTVEFAKQTGIKHIDLWGAEYWYYRMVKLHDPSVWNVAKQEFTGNSN